MSAVKTIQKYSHCVYGRYELRPPEEMEKKLGHMAGMDVEQYYEESSTGGAVPFKFLSELKMTPKGQMLFDAYLSALRVVSYEMCSQIEGYIRSKGIIIDTAAIKAITEISKRLAIQIRVFIPRLWMDKADVEILFFIDGEDKGETDFAKVCDAVGVVVISKLAECLLTPIAQAESAIKANL